MTAEQRERNTRVLAELRAMRACLVGMIRVGVMLANPRIGSTARRVLPDIQKQIQAYETALAK
jgi:hypothetical protein